MAIHEHRGCERLWLERISAQTICASQFEVIIVDGSNHLTYERVLSDFQDKLEGPRNISYHRIESVGRGKSLNHALDLASSDLVIFLADDFVASPEFVAAHLRFHSAHPEVEAVGVGCGLIPAELSSPFSTWLEESGELFGVPFRAGMTDIPVDFFYVGNASVKRELINRAGRFDERFSEHAWDDFEFGQRLKAAGMTTAFLPEASAEHVHQIDLAERERVMRSSGVAAKVYESIYPGAYEWSKLLDLSPLSHRFRTGSARARMLFNHSDKAAKEWWQCRLDAAFVKGYRDSADLLSH